MQDKTPNLKRRAALKLIASTAAATNLIAQPGLASTVQPAKLKARTAKDPDMLNPKYIWGLQLERDELVTLASLCDLIIPADDNSKSASALNVHGFINEHVSAPYDSNKSDLILIKGGLVWLNSESQIRFSKLFFQLSDEHKRNICDEVNWTYTALPWKKKYAEFFGKVRNLTASGYFTTSEGMEYIGYVGNKPMVTFPGAPRSVLEKLGLSYDD